MKIKKVFLLNLLIFSILFCFSSVVNAQNDQSQSDSVNVDQLYLVVKTNNVEYIGKILNDDGREVLILTEKLGKIYIPKSEIRSIDKISDKKSIVRNEYYGSGPFTTRYIFTTNALPIQKGQNYARINLYGPEVHFALTNNFSLGILTTWSVSPFLISAKYSFTTKNPKLNYSIGTLLGNSGYINNMKTWGALHYGNITYGTAKDNLSFGAGLAYVFPGVTDNIAPEGVYYGSDSYYNAQTSQKLNPVTGPVFSFSGITRVGSKASFVFDSMIAFGSAKTTFVSALPIGIDTRFVVKNGVENFAAFIIMPGMRFQTRDNSAFQISLNTIKIVGNNNGEETENLTFPLPSLSWFYKF